MVETALGVATGEIEAFCASDRVGIGDLEAIMACVSIHLALTEHCSAHAPEADAARSLRAQVLGIFDAEIDALSPQGDYKPERRAIMVATLDRYVAASRTE